jgi:hypothetical protein
MHWWEGLTTMEQKHKIKNEILFHNAKKLVMVTMVYGQKKN